jgi:hypothetical protein
LRQQLPSARTEDVRQGIVDLALVTEPDNVAILVHGVSFSFGDSGRFGRQPRYAAFLKPSSPSFVHSSTALRREGFEAFYGEDKRCHLRHIGTGAVAELANPHRPFSKEEVKRHELLASYLDKASEDELIGEVLMPLFRQLGFHRITAAGHRDKALEYGKDIWMRFTLPTQHVLYFGLQAKRDKLDAAGASKSGTANVAEKLNQVTMMLGHEIFDPETNRRVLVDHAFIVAGGEITKAARNWLGGKLVPRITEPRSLA